MKKRKYKYATRCRKCKFRYECGEPSWADVIKCMKREEGVPAKSSNPHNFSDYFPKKNDLRGGNPK